MIKTKLFNNGLRLVYKRSESKISHGCLLIGVGSRCENRNQFGFSHLIEHLLFKQTRNKNYLQIADAVESYGGDINAYTTKEDTVLYASISNQYFENVIDVFSDVVQNSLLNDKDILKEIEIVKDEIDYYKDSPSESIFDDFEELYYQDSSLSHNILGDKSALDLLRRDELFSFYKENYRLNNMVFSYAGGLLYEEVVDLLEKYFIGDNSNIMTESDFKIQDIKTNSFKKHIDKDLNQSHCIVGNVAVDACSSDKISMVLLNAYLAGSSFNSILNQKLREDRGLTYNIDSNYSQYLNTGLFTVYFGTDSSKVDECLQVIESEFSDLYNKGMSEELMNKWKIQMKGQLLLHYDNGVNIAITNAKYMMLYNNAYTVDEMMTQVDAISIDSMNRVINKSLHFNDFSLLKYE